MSKILYVGGNYKTIPQLSGTEFKVEYVQNGIIAINAVQSEDFDAVILEDQLPLMSVGHLTDELISRDNSVPVISIIRSEERKNKFLNNFGHGIFGWFEPKKHSAEELITLLNIAREYHKFFKALSKRDKMDFTAIGYGEIVGVSKKMLNLYNPINQIKNKDVTVLITGESGTGKNIIAKMLHEKGIRRDKPFVSVNCPAIPSELLESELFGHEKGAFTGAVERTDGKFSAANGGTIFLDEIGDMSSSLQSKVLRVLENGEMERVGSSKTIKVDVRIISATNQNLEEKINKGEFRNDLYHRINVFPVSVPSLKRRPEDIAVTAMFILKKLVTKHNTRARFISAAAVRVLQAYDWPGNVRELENIIERAVLLNDNPVLSKQNIIDLLQDDINNNDNNELGSTGIIQDEEAHPAVKTGWANETISSPDDAAPTEKIDHSVLNNNGSLKTLKQLEYEAIKMGLKITNWNMTSTAQQLGISRMTLYRKIEHHGLKKNG